MCVCYFGCISVITRKVYGFDNVVMCGRTFSEFFCEDLPDGTDYQDVIKIIKVLSSFLSEILVYQDY